MKYIQHVYQNIMYEIQTLKLQYSRFDEKVTKIDKLISISLSMIFKRNHSILAKLSSDFTKMLTGRIH